MRIFEITARGMEIDSDSARGMAELLASRLAGEVTLVAWFDGRTGKGHPDVPECLSKPGWLAYAENHGGEIKVNVNHYDFVFVFSAVRNAPENGR
jgi:hypothetical protein